MGSGLCGADKSGAINKEQSKPWDITGLACVFFVERYTTGLFTNRAAYDIVAPSNRARPGKDSTMSAMQLRIGEKAHEQFRHIGLDRHSARSYGTVDHFEIAP